jgi:hypothetical protein
MTQYARSLAGRSAQGADAGQVLLIALQGCAPRQARVGSAVVDLLCVRETYVAATQKKPTGKHMAAGGGHITFVHRTVIGPSRNR